jgi:small subunit ribosomal protein S6
LPVAKPTYDLVVLLDPASPPEERTKTLEDIRTQVKAGGEILLEQDWGDRALAYPIAHKEQAEYHLLQLHAEGPMIESLDRNLRLNDGVVRHRIIKLAPGTPAAPEQPRSATAPAAPPAAPPEPAAAAAPPPEPAPEPDALATA